jgi:hypothetical protein
MNKLFRKKKLMNSARLKTSPRLRLPRLGSPHHVVGSKAETVGVGRPSPRPNTAEAARACGAWSPRTVHRPWHSPRQWTGQWGVAAVVVARAPRKCGGAHSNYSRMGAHRTGRSMMRLRSGGGTTPFRPWWGVSGSRRWLWHPVLK